MGWLNFGGKKRDRAQGFGDSSKTKSRKRPKSFILEKIVTPSAGFGDWEHEFDQLHQLLGSLSLSDLHLPNFFADGGVCPIDPGAPTNNLPPLIDFDPLGLYHDGIATQTPYNPGGAFETLPVAVIPVDPHSPNPNNPNAIRQLLDFPLASQPLLGSIDTGVSADSPYLNYANIKKGRDYVGGDDNPLLKPGEGSEHGTFMLGIIDAINKTAPKWVGRAIDSGRWADSLVEFVDAAKASGQKNAIANLSLDLTQKNADGSVTTRYELTTAERSAIEYARQKGVMLVVAAGNDGGVMSVLGQASQEFDNIFTVGAGDINRRSNYSSYGRGLDIVADGGTTEHPGLSTVGNDLGTMAGTSVATAKVAGAASLVWAANPALNYRQVMEILKSTARDLGPVGWDDETGFGFLNTLAAVDLAKKTAPEVYKPTAWVTPDTWSGQGKVTPEERAAKGGNSLAAATVQASSSFSDSDRVDGNQPDKYYQFTVNEPGYVKWNLISLNLVSGFPTPPNVTVIKADGKPGSHIFSKGISLSSSVIGEGQTSFSGGNFYDPGTYYLKVGNGAGSSFKDYNISTQFIADKVSSFTGNIQYRTQPYYSLDNSLQSAVFSGPAVSELSNLSGVVTYDNIQFNNRIAKYGVEVNESGKIRINLNSPNGKMEVSVKKFIGSDDRPESIASLEVSANSDGWLELDLNKGRYDIEVKTPSNFWLEPDWNWTQEKLVRPYTLNATFTPNAPQPGQGKVPSSAGAFDKTVVSNGVVNHYYKNGYLTVQPSGQASWYGYPSGVVSISVQPLNDPVPLADPDGNYSIQTAQDLSYSPADFGDGVDRRGALGSIGGNNLNDFYKFSLNSLKLVNLKLSQLSNGAKLELIQDRNGNGQVDFGEVITTNLTGLNSPSSFSFDKILGAGSYYLRVSPGSSGATTKYQLDVAEQSPENQVIAGYNSDYYLVQNAQLRIIPNQETLNALKINPNTVKRFPPEDLARIPYGDALPSQKDGDVFADFAGNIYLMESGKRRLVPDWDTLRAMGINVTGMSRFPESDLKDIEPGDPYVRLNHWQASFINRNAGNVAQFNIDDFNNPVATLDLGVQGSGDGKISLYRNWGLDSPDNRVQKDYFAMQASTRTNMQAGKLYQVRTKSDDGTRFLLKNIKTGEVKTIEQLGGWSDGDWRGRGADEPNKIIYFKVPDSGDYDFYVQYYENDGGSTVNISMGEVQPVEGFNYVSDKTYWKSSVYWWDRTKAGDPPLDFQKAENKIGVYNLGQNDRSDGKKGISLDWRNGKLPNNDVTLPKNNFAISSYTQASFEQGKKYTASVYSDDGYQLYAINRSTSQRIDITPRNEWKKDAYGKHQPIDINVPPGDYDVYFNYFDGGGDAYFDLSWEGVQSQGDRLSQLSNKSSPLTIDEIIEYRQLIAKLPESQRAQWYRKLQNKTPYFNQRDNAKRNLADEMCNVTTLANCLTFLGVKNPQSNRQFEDVLDDILVDNPSIYGIDARYYGAQLSKLATNLGVTSSGQKWLGSFPPSNIEYFKQFVRDNWEPALNQGKAVMGDVYTTKPGHIIRVLDIDWNQGGIFVDDPFGTAKNSAGNDYQQNNYPTQDSRNNPIPGSANTQQGQDENGIGKRNFWSWSYCAEVFGNTWHLILENTNLSTSSQNSGSGSSSSIGNHVVSNAGLDFLIKHEGGVWLTLYDNDGGGNCTIGVGHLVHEGMCNGSEPQEFKQGITQERALEIFKADVSKFSQVVNNYVKVPLNQNQFDALVSFAFNVGEGYIRGTEYKGFIGSQLLIELNAGNYDKVPSEMNRWVTNGKVVVKGLQNRRADEAIMFSQGIYR